MLTAGARVGPYEVVEPLGAGGMGEVWRARDPRLERDVALKLLPDELAGNQARLIRFRREAKILASLNHPGIATLHGLEETNEEGPVLVMEVVEGETLEERIDLGPLPVGLALDVAAQIALALQAAHAQGVLHRDLKPGNVRLTPEGRVKVLDFGLAKVIDGAGAQAPLEHPTTVTESALTGPGALMGTLPYMSPEQVRGEEVDRRTDVWAFGCVLFELLTGRRAFGGQGGPEVLAAVLAREPAWEALPDATPPGVRKLLRRLLEKDRARRIHDIADARLEIEEAQSELLAAQPTDLRGLVGIGRMGWRPWRGGLVALLAAGALAIHWARPTPLSRAPAIKRLTLAPPAGVALLNHRESHQHLAISPSGDRVAFVGVDQRVADPRRQIYEQSVDDIEARAVPGTMGALSPFFSQDGQWIAFQQGNLLKKARLGGSEAPITIAAPSREASVTSLRGASWSADGMIVFSPGPYEGLWAVSADGSAPPRALTTVDREKGEKSHRWPQFLPGGRHVLFGIMPGSSKPRDARIAVLSLDSGRWQTLTEGAAYARYSPSGHLIVARQGKLLAAPLELVRLQVIGTPFVQVLEDVQMELAAHFYADFDISHSGSLVYVPGYPRPVERSLLWVDREGRAEALKFRRQPFFGGDLSPDGRRLAVQILREPHGADLFVLDLERGSSTQLTSDADDEPMGDAVWSADGRWLAFTSRQGVMRVAADGSDTRRRLTGYMQGAELNAWTSDGQGLIFTQQTRDNWQDIGMISVENGQIRWLLSERYAEFGAALSADGRMLAYVSAESGRYEVYVSSFPGMAEGVRVSTLGGMHPRWSRDGRELFYRSLGERPKLMAVTVESQGRFRVGPPRPLFDDVFAGRETVVGMPFYDIAADGERFLFFEEPAGAPRPTRLVLVPDWQSELRAKLSARP